jgi:protein involved in polysaccharide export with SLBB domain
MPQSTRRRWSRVSSFVAGLAVSSTLCVAQVPSVKPASTSPYRVQVNDVLEFLFFKNTELNQTRTVGPDGEVSLQLVGVVRVAGRTVPEITAEVTTRYARELVQPQITVAIKEYSGLKVYVGGEINSPGIQVYRGGLSALQAIVAAGGFKTTASLKSVVLIRKCEGGRPVGSRVDLSRVLKHAEFERDVALAPSDIVFVPRSGIANVNLFVEQWFRNNIPIPIYLGFTPFD